MKCDPKGTLSFNTDEEGKIVVTYSGVLWAFRSESIASIEIDAATINNYRTLIDHMIERVDSEEEALISFITDTGSEDSTAISTAHSVLTTDKYRLKPNMEEAPLFRDLLAKTIGGVTVRTILKKEEDRKDYVEWIEFPKGAIK